MGVSIYLKGYVSPDNDTYKKHAAVLKACRDAGIKEMPKETAEYFGSKEPYLDLLEKKLETEELPYNETEYGFELLVADIPKDVHKLKFEFC